nr:hypothetical protein L203_04979 [Cryptococcus depauperatus CBS 7841]
MSEGGSFHWPGNNGSVDMLGPLYEWMDKNETAERIFRNDGQNVFKYVIDSDGIHDITTVEEGIKMRIASEASEIKDDKDFLSCVEVVNGDSTLRKQQTEDFETDLLAYMLFPVDPLRRREQVINELGHTLWKAARESLTKGIDSGQVNEPPSESGQQLDRVCGCSTAVSHQPAAPDAWLLSEKELTYCWHAVMGKATLGRMG